MIFFFPFQVLHTLLSLLAVVAFGSEGEDDTVSDGDQSDTPMDSWEDEFLPIPPTIVPHPEPLSHNHDPLYCMQCHTSPTPNDPPQIQAINPQWPTDIDTGSVSSYPSTDSLPSLYSDSSSDFYETSISPLPPSSPVPIAGENGNPHIFGFFPTSPASPPYHNQIPDPNHITPIIPLNNPTNSSIPLNAAQLVHLFLQGMHTPTSDSEDQSDEL